MELIVEGVKTGAERLARVTSEWLSSHAEEDGEHGKTGDDIDWEYISGAGNMYESLAAVEAHFWECGSSVTVERFFPLYLQ